MTCAIVYTSNTGYTAEYARILGEETKLPVFSLARAIKELPKGSDIIYLGWIMANHVKGFRKAAKNFNLCAVCGVGMMKSESKLDAMRTASGLPENLRLFSLQGGFDIQKLHGIYKTLMKMMSKAIVKDISKKAEKTSEELEILRLMQDGGNFVCRENLAEVLAWMQHSAYKGG